jgi:hypothetical protein
MRIHHQRPSSAQNHNGGGIGGSIRRGSASKPQFSSFSMYLIIIFFKNFKTNNFNLYR